MLIAIKKSIICYQLSLNYDNIEHLFVKCNISAIS